MLFISIKISMLSWIIMDLKYELLANSINTIVRSKIEKAFDDDNRNNWKESSLRKYLNGEFYEDLQKKIDKIQKEIELIKNENDTIE